MNCCTRGVKANLYSLKCRKYVLMMYSTILRTSSGLNRSMLNGGRCTYNISYSIFDIITGQRNLFVSFMLTTVVGY